MIDESLHSVIKRDFQKTVTGEKLTRMSGEIIKRVSCIENIDHHCNRPLDSFCFNFDFLIWNFSFLLSSWSFAVLILQIWSFCSWALLLVFSFRMMQQFKFHFPKSVKEVKEWERKQQKLNYVLCVSHFVWSSSWWAVSGWRGGGGGGGAGSGHVCQLGIRNEVAEDFLDSRTDSQLFA